jgi:hypothetical protein
MELKMVYRIGSLKIRGELIGVTMAISRWNGGRICVVRIVKVTSPKIVIFFVLNLDD